MGEEIVENKYILKALIYIGHPPFSPFRRGRNKLLVTSFNFFKSKRPDVLKSKKYFLLLLRYEMVIIIQHFTITGMC